MVVFKGMYRTLLLKVNIREKIYYLLFTWNINKSVISQALINSFKDSSPDMSFLELFLIKGTDPNKDNSYCFGIVT